MHVDSRTELDTHADTCVVGKHCLITHEFDRLVSVTGYDPNQGKVKDLKIVSAVVAYDCHMTGEVIIIRINQAIYIKSMVNNLLCPMQIRMNDIKVFDCPKFLIDKPDYHEHTLSIPSAHGEDYIIPLSLHGVTSYFPTRKPTQDEYRQAEHSGSVIELTYDSPDWDPHTDSFNEQEIVASKAIDIQNSSPNRQFCSVQSQSHIDAETVFNRNSQTACVLSEISPCLNDDSFISLMKENVFEDISSVAQVTSSNKQLGITATDLVRNWGIGL